MTTQSIEGAMPPLPDLLPCPFCGAGETSIFENGKMWLGMKYSEPSSVSVRHHCPQIDGQPSRMIERVGRDHASAAEAWNRRTPDAAPLLARVAELEAALRLVLPMAKGYAHTYPVGSNQAYCDQADAALAAHKEQP